MNKTAVVTGASRGIGRAIAIEFSEKKYNLILGFKENKRAADKVLNEVRSNGAEGSVIQVDISKRDSITKFWEQVIEQFGAPDVLVNNAGINIKSDPLSFTDELFDLIFHTNVRGLYLCSILAAQEMMRRNIENRSDVAVPIRGRIMNISAVPGRTVLPRGMTLYGASKAAVDSLTKSLAAELGPQGILVNGVAPGITDTDLIKHDSEETKNNLIQRSALKRLGKPIDMALFVSYLAEDEWMVGQCVNLSGGRPI